MDEEEGSVPLDSNGVHHGIKLEREKTVAYLRKSEGAGLAKVASAETDESSKYQETVANSITAMRRALEGGYHWK